MHYLCMQAVAINNRSLLKTPPRPREFFHGGTAPHKAPFRILSRSMHEPRSDSFWLARCKLFFFFFFSTMQLPTNTCNHVSHRHVYKHVYNRLANYELETHLPPPLWCLKISAMLVEWISLGAILAKTSTLVSEYQTFYRNSSHPARKFHPRETMIRREVIFYRFSWGGGAWR